MAKIFTKDLSDFARKFQKEVQKDMNEKLYVAQQALNNTAFRARNNLLKKYQSVFHVRNKNFFSLSAKKGVLVEKADRKKDGLDMHVRLTFPYDWFKIQAFGGTKTTADLKKQNEHKQIAIPTSQGAVKINQSGRITGAGATRMVAYSLKHPKKTKGHVATPHAFIMKNATAKGKDVIAKRSKSDRKHIDWFFVLQPRIEVKKKWDFNGVIHATFQRHLDEEFAKAEKWVAEHPKK